jgi:hypothetical protein
MAFEEIYIEAASSSSTTRLPGLLCTRRNVMSAASKLIFRGGFELLARSPSIHSSTVYDSAQEAVNLYDSSIAGTKKLTKSCPLVCWLSWKRSG